MTEKCRTCDIFCRVVDNYGDIGVCWRLARQLSAEHGYRLRLWVDDLASFALLCPDLQPTLAAQELRGVELRRWDLPFADVTAADLVIEAFGCQLPENYLAAMVARPPAWINLEYLSAESWIASHHGLASPHPRLPLVKHFFFPGFDTASGGLLREAGLAARQREWRCDWAELGLAAPAPDEICISLFCYDNPALPSLLQAWSEGDERINCLLAAGPAQSQAASWLGRPSLTPGQRERRGQLSLRALPFLDQEKYDKLLWSCDINFVRGEDSFVRAQWAARPLLWQAYPQPEDAHLAKLAAFLDRYCVGLAPSVGASYREFASVWNGGSQRSAADAWRNLAALRRALAEQARNWADRLAAQEDLATRLVKFVEALI